jgi:hypothetical protein
VLTGLKYTHRSSGNARGGVLFSAFGEERPDKTERPAIDRALCEAYNGFKKHIIADAETPLSWMNWYPCW